MQMITSSNFFEKSIFTLEDEFPKMPTDYISPWEQTPHNQLLKSKIPVLLKAKKKDRYSTKLDEAAKYSQRSYIKKKLRSQSQLDRSYQIIRTQINDENKTQSKIENKLALLRQRGQIKNAVSVQFRRKQRCSHAKKTKKLMNKQQNSSSIKLPEIEINQFKGLNPHGDTIPKNAVKINIFIKNNRKRILDQVSKNRSPRCIINKSFQVKNILSSRYVCAVQNPSFNIQGQSTTKFNDF